MTDNNQDVTVTCENGVITVIGNTYDRRKFLKNDGYKWDPEEKAWSRDFSENSESAIKSQHVHALTTFACVDYHEAMKIVGVTPKY